jgi:hypothetical protein
MFAIVCAPALPATGEEFARQSHPDALELSYPEDLSWLDVIAPLNCGDGPPLPVVSEVFSPSGALDSDPPCTTDPCPGSGNVIPPETVIATWTCVMGESWDTATCWDTGEVPGPDDIALVPTTTPIAIPAGTIDVGRVVLAGPVTLTVGNRIDACENISLVDSATLLLEDVTSVSARRLNISNASLRSIVGATDIVIDIDENLYVRTTPGIESSLELCGASVHVGGSLILNDFVLPKAKGVSYGPLPPKLGTIESVAASNPANQIHINKLGGESPMLLTLCDTGIQIDGDLMIDGCVEAFAMSSTILVGGSVTICHDCWPSVPFGIGFGDLEITMTGEDNELAIAGDAVVGTLIIAGEAEVTAIDACGTMKPIIFDVIDVSSGGCLFTSSIEVFYTTLIEPPTGRPCIDAGVSMGP